MNTLLKMMHYNTSVLMMYLCVPVKDPTYTASILNKIMALGDTE